MNRKTLAILLGLSVSLVLVPSLSYGQAASAMTSFDKLPDWSWRVGHDGRNDF